MKYKVLKPLPTANIGDILSSDNGFGDLFKEPYTSAGDSIALYASQINHAIEGGFIEIYPFTNDDLDGFGTGMKVRHLIKMLNEYREEYGDDFLDWDVYLEQCTEDDKEYKRGEQEWDIKRSPEYKDDPEEFWNEYFAVLGGIGRCEKDKCITINVNY